MTNVLVGQWGLLVGSSILLYLISPMAKSREGFFSGASRTKEKPGVMMLTFSLVISWIFAKSIANASNLGMSFGIVGGLAYGMYYLSFLIAGFIIYKMRTRSGFTSLHHFLESKFGRSAVLLFSLVISIRLLNEVWSNTAVIGNYFGEAGSLQYIIAVITFTLLTLAYAVKGGLRSSLVTDMIQMVLFGLLLFIILGIIIPRQGSVTTFFSSGTWSMATGLNLFFVALIQIFSYPFHDPVLTDRGFISDEKTTLKSYILASLIGFVCIVLFSFIGIYGQLQGFKGQATIAVSQTFGLAMMLLTNFIMITSAASTLDSTFSSVSKLVVVDLNQKQQSVSRGRWVMVITAIGGSLPLLFTPEIISATTVSGTMVLGLAPIFIFWKLPAPKLSFHLALWSGVCFGLILTFGLLPEGLYLTSGKYADLFAVNVYGTITCFSLYLLPMFLQRKQLSSRG